MAALRIASTARRLTGLGCLAALIASAVPITDAAAAGLVYRPVNPSFGGRPLNGNFLLGGAQAQNDFDDPDQRDDGGEDLNQRFIRALESRLLSGLASQVSEAIFGDDGADDGQIVFGNQTINFSRGLDQISVEIIDTDTGSSTLIEVPALQLN